MNHLNIFILNLIIVTSIFFSSSLWADENTNFGDKLAHADKVKSSDPKQFLMFVNELNQNANRLSSTQHHYLDYLNLYLLIYKGELENAITAAQRLLNSNADSLLKFRAKLSLINIFSNNQSWSEGLSTISNMLTELSSIEDKELHSQGLLLAAMFYNQLGQYNLSLSYAKQVESSSMQGRDLCFAKGEIIKSSFKLKQLTPTNPIINDTISLCHNNKELIIISLIKSYTAKFYLDNQEQDKALQLLNTSLQDTLNTKYPRLIAEYYSLLAHAHWLNKNTELTKIFALKALEHEKQAGTTVAKVLSFKLLFEVSQAQRKFELALHYHQRYAIADKLYYDENQAKYLAFQLAEHQAIEQQGKIALLNKQNTLLTAEQALTRANVDNNRLIILVLALTLSVLTFWGLRLLTAHKRIKELAEYDALTGIFNRGHFTQVATKALSYCQSAEQDISLIMFDLDHFKNINDSYGHACGDWALKQTVKTCKRVGRKSDIFARLGGEEFCILMTGCDKKTAYARAEDCRLAIADINTADSGFEFIITASFGVTDASTSGFDLEQLLADADCAAYAAKRNGRNKVSAFQVNKQFSLQLV